MASAGTDLPLDGFSGYLFQGPYTEHPEFLDDEVFWLYHLSRSPFVWSYAEKAQEDFLLKPHEEACDEFHQRLLRDAEWTAFPVPLKSGSSLHIVYSPMEESHVCVGYHLSHPGWDQTETLAYLYGNYDGYPALSWPELAAAAGSGVPGGSTEDPHKRLILLWPAMGDDAIPEQAAATLSAALSACTSVPDPDRLARLFVAAQKCARWRFEDSVRVTDHRASVRTPPGHHRSLSRDGLARVSAALELPVGSRADELFH